MVDLGRVQLVDVELNWIYFWIQRLFSLNDIRIIRRPGDLGTKDWTGREIDSIGTGNLNGISQAETVVYW